MIYKKSVFERKARNFYKLHTVTSYNIAKCSNGVVWHTGMTGKVLACGAVGPRFNSRQGQGIL